MPGDKFIPSVLYNLFGNGLAGILQVISGILLARHLGVSQWGELSLLLLVPPLMFNFASFGFEAATTHLVGAAKVSVRECQVFNLVSSICLVIFGFLIAPWILKLALQNSHGTLLIGNRLMILMACLAIMVFGKLQGAIVLGQSRFRTANMILFSQHAIYFAGVCSLMYTGMVSIDHILLLYLASQVVGAFLNFWCVMSTKSSTASTQLGLSGYFRMAFSYGIRVQAANLTAFLNYRADILILNYFHGPNAVGLYKIAVDLAEKLWLIPMSIGKAIFSKSAGVKKGPEFCQHLTATIQLSFYSTLIIVVIVAIVFGYVIPEVYGREYVESVVPFRWLLFGILAGSVTKVVSNAISAIGRPGINSFHTSIALCVNVVANLALIPSFSIAGAAIGTSIAYIILAGVKLMATKGLLGGSMSGWYRFPVQHVRLILDKSKSILKAP